MEDIQLQLKIDRYDECIIAYWKINPPPSIHEDMSSKQLKLHTFV